jgi:hypothetical protein
MFNYQDLLKRIDQAGSPQGLPQMPQSMVGVDPSGGINNVQAAMQQGMMPPVPTAIPQMQPAPQQMQPATQQMQPATQQQPGLLSRIGTGFQNLIQDKDKMQDLQALFNSMSYSPDAGIQQAYADRQKMRTVSAQANQTAAYLRQQGQPELAAMVEANPALAKDALAEFTKKKMGTAYSSKNVGSVQTAQQDIMKDGKILVLEGGQYTYDYNPNATSGEQYTIIPLSGNALTDKAKAELLSTSAREQADYEKAFKVGTEMLEKGIAVDSQITKYQRIRDLISKEGADTGLIDQWLPAFDAATAELRSMANSLGIDIINSATFGALSAPELRLALSTALPQGLSGAQLLTWVDERISAQSKLRDELVKAGEYLVRPSTNYSDYAADLAQKTARNTQTASYPIGDKDMSYGLWNSMSAQQRNDYVAAGDQ